MKISVLLEHVFYVTRIGFSKHADSFDLNASLGSRLGGFLVRLWGRGRGGVLARLSFQTNKRRGLSEMGGAKE